MMPVIAAQIEINTRDRPCGNKTGSAMKAGPVNRSIGDARYWLFAVAVAASGWISPLAN